MQGHDESQHVTRFYIGTDGIDLHCDGHAAESVGILKIVYVPDAE
jgi:hypothetical protein